MTDYSEMTKSTLILLLRSRDEKIKELTWRVDLRDMHREAFQFIGGMVASQAEMK